ncbi:MAG TPA: carbohydrate ABC transporter permease, partial [Paenibacillus sp.]|nr:carbohydrate ABC transporter permease [Paenibacillus sp.]
MFGIWNDFINPLIYLQDTNKMTAITYIYNFKQKYSTDWGAVFAVCTLISVPLLIVFGVVQKRLFQSVAAGALKG